MASAIMLLSLLAMVLTIWVHALTITDRYRRDHGGTRLVRRAARWSCLLLRFGARCLGRGAAERDGWSSDAVTQARLLATLERCGLIKDRNVTANGDDLRRGGNSWWPTDHGLETLGVY